MLLTSKFRGQTLKLALILIWSKSITSQYPQEAQKYQNSQISILINENYDKIPIYLNSQQSKEIQLILKGCDNQHLQYRLILSSEEEDESLIQYSKVVCSSENNNQPSKQYKDYISIKTDECGCQNSEKQFYFIMKNESYKLIRLTLQVQQLIIAEDDDSTTYMIFFVVGLLIFFFTCCLVYFLCHREQFKTPLQIKKEILNKYLPSQKVTDIFGQYPALSSISECQICLIHWNIENDIARLTPCFHFFHEHCIDEWLVKNESCPCCRAGITKESLEQLNKCKKHNQKVKTEAEYIKRLKEKNIQQIQIGPQLANYTDINLEENRDPILMVRHESKIILKDDVQAKEVEKNRF